MKHGSGSSPSSGRVQPTQRVDRVREFIGTQMLEAVASRAGPAAAQDSSRTHRNLNSERREFEGPSLKRVRAAARSQSDKHPPTTHPTATLITVLTLHR